MLGIYEKLVAFQKGAWYLGEVPSIQARSLAFRRWAWHLSEFLVIQESCLAFKRSAWHLREVLGNLALGGKRKEGERERENTNPNLAPKLISLLVAL